MGDFLDDYLDGLSSGMQRFDPIPTGPYNGTKQKRLWHLMADSEREQAIYEARMREEEDSAGYGEGGSGSGPVQAVDSAEQPASDPIVEYPTIAATETFGSITTPAGNVSYIEEELTASGYPDTQVVVTQQTHEQLINDMNILTDPTHTSYTNDIYSLGMSLGTGVVWVTPTQPVNNSYPGWFDDVTGVAKPMYAIGANYAIVFRIIDQVSIPAGGVFAIETSDTLPTSLNFTPGDPSVSSMTDLALVINTYSPSRDLLNLIKQEYEAQTQKYWSYGVVEVGN